MMSPHIYPIDKIVPCHVTNLTILFLPLSLSLCCCYGLGICRKFDIQLWTPNLSDIGVVLPLPLYLAKFSLCQMSQPVLSVA